MKISLVIPAYNESNRITHTLDKITQYMNQTFKDFEIIVADDGSEDNTVEIAKSYENLGVTVFSFKHAGKGNTLKQAIMRATGDYIFFTDADLPYALENMSVALEQFAESKVDLVIGARDLELQKDGVPYPFYRNLMSKAFSFVVNFVLKLGIKDTQCGFKGFTKEVAHTIFPQITVLGFGFDIELLTIAKLNGYQIHRIPVNLTHSKGSKVNAIKDTYKMLKDIFTVKSNTKRGIYEINSNPKK